LGGQRKKGGGMDGVSTETLRRTDPFRGEMDRLRIKFFVERSLLDITLPKVEEAKKKKIEIKVK